MTVHRLFIFTQNHHHQVLWKQCEWELGVYFKQRVSLLPSQKCLQPNSFCLLY